MPPKKKKDRKRQQQQQQPPQQSRPLSEDANSPLHPAVPSIVGSTGSYQQPNGDGHGHGAAARPAARPTVRNYYADGLPGGDRDVRAFFALAPVAGDASLRPNVGLTNSYDDALFGMALHELLERLRLGNMLCAAASVLLAAGSWLARLVVTWRVDQLLLSAYLAALSLVLLLTEGMNLYNVGRMDAWLRDNFGLLRHPLGKATYLLLLSSLCFGIGAIPEFVVGAAYLASAALLLYTWGSYPEFRALFREAPQVDHDDGASVAAAPPSARWSAYAASPFAKASSSSGRANGEYDSLLGSNGRNIIL